MQYDVLHLPGPPVGGCGEVAISPDLASGHARGERISLACPACGRYGEVEVRAALEGLES